MTREDRQHKMLTDPVERLLCALGAPNHHNILITAF